MIVQIFEEYGAFFDLLYLALVKKASHSNFVMRNQCNYFGRLSNFWFHTLVEATRFEDSNIKKQQAEVDHLAPLDNIFDPLFKSR